MPEPTTEHDQTLHSSTSTRINTILCPFVTAWSVYNNRPLASANLRI